MIEQSSSFVNWLLKSGRNVIENREIKRSPALTRCVSETLSSLVRAVVEDSRELTRMALHVGRKFSKEFGPIDEGDNLSHYC